MVRRSTCARCGHPRLGGRLEGHFSEGTCKVPECACPGFLSARHLVDDR